MKKIYLLPLSFSLIMALLSACTLPANTQGETAGPVRAWFDAPLPNSVFLPPNPCLIVAHGASPQGIAAFELSINGAAIEIPSPDSQSSLVTLSQDCGLSEPGDYFLRLRARDNAGNWSGYAETRLTIAGRETGTPPPAPEETGSVSPTPTLTTTVEPAAGVSIESVSTNLVYLGQASCGPLEVTITTRAVAPNGINVLVLFYRFQTASSSSDFQSIVMSPAGGDLYQRSLNPTSILGGSVPFDQATLQYQIVVQQNDGDTSLRTPVMSDITVEACGSLTSCSSFTSESTCTSNGCNWVLVPGVVPVYECRNP